MVNFISADNTAELCRNNLIAILRQGVGMNRRVGDWCMKKSQTETVYEIGPIILELKDSRNIVTSQHCLGAEVETEDYLLGLNPGFVHRSPWSFYKRWLYKTEDAMDRTMYKYPYTYGQRGGQYLEALIEKIRSDPSSRHLVIPLFQIDDMNYNQFAPCTTQWHFNVTPWNELEMNVTMRSQDACRGIFLDTFAYPLIQQYVASRLNMKLGRYRHIILNSHVYASDMKFAHTLVDTLTHVGPVDIGHGLDKKVMREMLTISELIYAEPQPSEHQMKMAYLLIERLPEFWMNWKKSQYLYVYTKYFSEQRHTTELTCKGLIVNALPVRE
jgi:thymidylate synthase